MEPPIEGRDNEPSAAEHTLGRVGRSLNKLDLRKQIEQHPFAAVGIAAAAGALVGLVRPKPQPGRLSSLIVTTLGAIGFRLVREAAVRELGAFARSYLSDRHDADEQTSPLAGQDVEGGAIRYTPGL